MTKEAFLQELNADLENNWEGWSYYRTANSLLFDQKGLGRYVQVYTSILPSEMAIVQIRGLRGFLSVHRLQLPALWARREELLREAEEEFLANPSQQESIRREEQAKAFLSRR